MLLPTVSQLKDLDQHIDDNLKALPIRERADRSVDMLQTLKGFLVLDLYDLAEAGLDLETISWASSIVSKLDAWGELS